MNTKERILKLISVFGLSKAEFERVCGLSNGYINSIRNNVGEKGLNLILERFPNVNKTWLVFGEGEMLNDKPTPQKVEQEAEPAGHIRYWADVSASGGSVDFLMNPDEHESWLINPPNFPDCTDAVNFYGNSMFPLYKSGEIIVLKEWKESFINYGEVYLIVTKNGNRMVKYLHKSADESKVICRSENKDFDSFEIEKNDILRLFIVKGAITRKSV